MRETGEGEEGSEGIEVEAVRRKGREGRGGEHRNCLSAVRLDGCSVGCWEVDVTFWSSLEHLSILHNTDKDNIIV